MRLKHRIDPDALTVNGRPVRLDSARLLGVGYEAEVFDLGGGFALKRFKRPDHPDFVYPDDRKAAADRLVMHQTKLPALMRLSLPPRVVAPLAFALDSSGQIAGYTMPLVSKAEVLLRYTDRTFRQSSGIANPTIIAVLADLHRTVTALHQGGVVIGDFNDLNVLVSGTAAHLIDVDSFQFGSFLTPLFCLRFLDPRLIDARTLLPVRPHDPDSDWYAFAVMAFQLLLYVEPYGGIYKGLNHDGRLLQRITVFHRDVRYPRQAIAFKVLPDDLLHRFQQTFERDLRGEFPLPLLESLRWTRCKCGAEHARAMCPLCATAAPAVARPLRVVHGRVSSELIFTTKETIIAAALQDDRLVWTERQGEVLGPRYWIEGDSLLRDGRLGPERVGSILGGLTRFWVGESFGFGFYRAGEMTVAFVFDTHARGIRDGVQLPRIGGQLIDADAVFANDRCWLFVATQEKGRIRHRCTVIRRDGSIEATMDA
ncbi:MAG TPA: hypothetical protein VII12_16945, partial [Thermoanaerobaculia bacterium]